MHDVTGLLLSWRQGDAEALDRRVPLVYEELRRVARRHLRREQPEHALQAAALVHEVYLRLVDVDRLTLKNRIRVDGRRRATPEMIATYQGPPASSAAAGAKPMLNEVSPLTAQAREHPEA